MDEIDEEILRELKADGRISNAELATRVNLSASACLRRVQELTRLGIIKGYRAVLDRGKLGLGFTAYIQVSLATHTKDSQDTFEQSISGSEEVVECHNITGAYEYLLRVETRDLASYKSFHTDFLGTIPQVRSIVTHVVMDSPKEERS
jgi:DNA-binding Lrp family transcriptional regulator